MNDLLSRALELQNLAHELMYLGMDGAPIYSDDFSRLNKDVLIKSESLFPFKSSNVEEEANICLSLLIGYNATIYDNGNKQQCIQDVLDRCWEVLPKLLPTLLKVSLLTYCYGESYEEDLLIEARAIINTWDKATLTLKQIEIIGELNNLEENQYPWEEVKE